jgi:NAD-dependent dihydropyrimidine dehydrogenase PreA subunit
MAYVITEPCIDVKDATCVDVCPVDCIHTTGDDNQYYINPDICIPPQADAACEPVCPVNAIFFEDDVPQEWKSDIEKNRLYFQKHNGLGAAFRQRSERR